MKQLKLTFLLTVFMSMVGARAFAYDAKIDGIYYNFSETEAIVTYEEFDFEYRSDYSGNVIIPESVIYDGKTYRVTEVSDHAFEGCSGLTLITIPISVTSIGSNAFNGCSGLTSITIPNSVTNIGTYAFSGCSGLISVTIGNGVTRIGKYAFYGCSDLEKVIVIDFSAWCAISFDNYSSNPLTNAHHLYNNNDTEITNLVIPNDVTSIGSYAFIGCSGLTSITIPNSVTSIGDDAFANCSGLTSVKVPVTDYAAFCGNKVVGLFFFNTSEYHPIILIDEEGNEITEYVIPDDVLYIGSYAFIGCSGLTSISIPQSVRVIGSNAFDGCSNLTSIKVPVTDYSAFCNNTVMGLISTSIGKPVHLIDKKGIEIKEYVIPEDVTSIGSSAFYGCSGLTSVTIPNSVTSIGSSAFKECSGLTSVTIPYSITSIGGSAFAGCSLSSVTFHCKEIRSWFSGMTSITKVGIAGEVTNIGSSAFQGCSGLISVTIPNSVTKIEESAFRNCTGLTSVTIPNSVTSIGSSAFYGCSGLTSVTIPNSVTIIGYDVFSYCKGLTSVSIPNSVTCIRENAFEGCSGLTSVTIPNSVTKIEESAFSYCTGLTSITIPNSVTSIDKYAFSGCSGLTSVTIPNSVTWIGGCAFSWCTNLISIISLIESPYSIHCKDDVWHVFEGSTWSHATLYVPVGTIDKYKATNGWKDFVRILEGEPAQYFDVSVDMSKGGSVLVNDKKGNKVNLKKGSDVVLQFMPNEGYKLEKVLVNDDDVTNQVIDGCYTMKEISDDIMVKVMFSVNKYKLTYQVDGEEYMSSEVEYGSNITAEAAPTKEGYTFSGWSEIPATMPAHDVTITGTFNVNQYTITYMIDDEVYLTESVDYGSIITPLSAPMREGYTFEWTDVPETMPAHDITIVGSYTSGINDIKADDEDVKWYTLDGKQIEQPRKGLNIVRMSNGKTKKVLVK